MNYDIHMTEKSETKITGWWFELLVFTLYAIYCMNKTISPIHQAKETHDWNVMFIHGSSTTRLIDSQALSPRRNLIVGLYVGTSSSGFPRRSPPSTSSSALLVVVPTYNPPLRFLLVDDITRFICKLVGFTSSFTKTNLVMSRLGRPLLYVIV